MLIFNSEILSTGKKLRNFILFDIWVSIDSFTFFKSKFQKQEHLKDIISKHVLKQK